MKKVLFFVFLSVLLGGCASWFYPNVKKYENVRIGMTLGDFKQAHRKALCEYMDSKIEIYSITYFDTEKKVVNKLSDAAYKKFYYFVSGKLDHVDKGERAIDYRIEIRHR